MSNIWRMEEDENVQEEMDDREIRMDLTDDLLHMVFILLSSPLLFCFVFLSTIC